MSGHGEKQRKDRGARPRPLDLHQQLVIVRNLDELNEEGIATRALQHGQAATEAEPARPPRRRRARPRLGATARDARAGPPGVPSGTRHNPDPNALLVGAALQAHGHGHGQPKAKAADIPTPEVWTVASYEADYRPTFKVPPTYIRGAPPPARGRCP